jgi:putative Holliday junction resolvase
MKILGIDWGRSKIGLALSDGPLSEPLGIIRNKNWQAAIKRICEEQGIETIVVGVAEGAIAEPQKSFGKKIEKIVGLPVVFQDETLTSFEAIAKMKEVGKKIKDEDAISAAIILQNYLDRQQDV